MTLNTGYCDSCYVTNQKDNTAEVDKPEVYFFEDPIDTREIAVYFDAILSNFVSIYSSVPEYGKCVLRKIFIMQFPSLHRHYPSSSVL